MAGTGVMGKNASRGMALQSADKMVIDLHVHALGGDWGKSLRGSKELAGSPAFASMPSSVGERPLEAAEEAPEEVLLHAVDSSEEVGYSVLLAIDGVYKNGRFVDAESPLVVPNDYVIGVAKRHKKVLFGASVHPYRLADRLIAETERSIGEGAVLFLWAPSDQQINPEDDRCIPFYLRLAREGVPLFCHAGTEFTMGIPDPRISGYSDPRRLTRALDIGVKVIVAQYQFPSAAAEAQSGAYFEELISMLREAGAKRWELSADISVFCTPTRISCLERIGQEIAEGRISPRRFLYGSGFPMQDSGLSGKAFGLGRRGAMAEGEENPLDNHFRMTKQFGIHDSIFTNASDVLRL
jgi:predicted TIM-barrel fold metal-dependent hydrolase